MLNMLSPNKIAHIRDALHYQGIYHPQVEPFIQKMAQEQDEWGQPIDTEVILDFARSFFEFSIHSEGKFDWEYIQSIPQSKLIEYVSLPDHYMDLGLLALSRTVVLKLNGGLGTSMGLAGAKSSIVVDTIKNKTFLEFIRSQLDCIEKECSVDIPLWFLNSFHTQKDTKSILNASQQIPAPYEEILQNRFPKIDLSANQPEVFNVTPFLCPHNPCLEWNPSGHGDIYRSLRLHDRLKKMIRSGKKYIFISNSDNLGAVLDPKILGYMDAHQIDFLMEATPKTEADTKGGTIISYHNRLCLLERAQVPTPYLSDFENCQRFPVFNTNNIWINLEALDQLLDSESFDLPLIINRKTVEGHPVAQLETAMGAAIQHFARAKILLVPRSRFLPVKTNADLLLLRSDYIMKTADTIFINPSRQDKSCVPTIYLSSHYAYYADFERFFSSIPSLLNLRRLHVIGAVHFAFKATVVLEGDVHLETDSAPIQIYGAVVLKNIRIQAAGSAVEITSLSAEPIHVTRASSTEYHVRMQDSQIVVSYQDQRWWIGGLSN